MQKTGLTCHLYVENHFYRLSPLISGSPDNESYQKKLRVRVRFPVPSFFVNTKEIPKNTKENRYRICFGLCF